ncbi:putative amidase [Talaromyces proteolyticus]|uniref:Amidase n=1 Tax=Talaromyces proteolyticus TaxID=1131652 RepID=A0AAD4KRN9_9EURO|nr:putative amidase [Talaromyces proteolyticus]KAH8697760.1 putative amidase [Talaromyces proteolyticus]
MPDPNSPAESLINDAPKWKLISTRARLNLWNSIPARWRLPSTLKIPDTNLQCVALHSGILTPKQIEVTELTTTELILRVHAASLTAVEITEAFCARAAIAHQLVNCLTEFFPEEAIEAAKALDAEFSRTRILVGPLHGIPIAIKDTWTIKGKRATNGCAAWYDRPPAEEDAPLIQVMRDSGAIIFGRTTMPQTGMALETVSPLWGRTLNPYNINFGSGGSYGGDGALVAMYGAPCAPFIRNPAAFNGLYGIRPTSDRTPRTGMASQTSGQISIKASAGSCCRSMSDIKLLTKLILTHPTVPYEHSCIPGFWNEVPSKSKLAVGVMWTDDVVTPHPPVTRALKEVASRLQAAGHDIIDFKPPIDLWEAAITTWTLYFQNGVDETKAALSSTGEPLIAQFQYNLDAFNVRKHTVAEILESHKKQDAYKASFIKKWNTTANETTTGQPIDCIIAPSAPLAGSPHDFCLWWGYMTIWNLLDYPSTIMPLKDFKIDPVNDARVAGYQPRDNPFDKPNWEIYTPGLWKNQPMTFQIVGRNCRDEELIAASEVIDSVVNKGHTPTYSHGGL